MIDKIDEIDQEDKIGKIQGRHNLVLNRDVTVSTLIISPLYSLVLKIFWSTGLNSLQYKINWSNEQIAKEMSW